MLDIDILVRTGGVWRHAGAYGRVTDAYERIRVHTDAYKRIRMHLDAYGLYIALDSDGFEATERNYNFAMFTMLVCVFCIYGEFYVEY